MVSGLYVAVTARRVQFLCVRAGGHPQSCECCGVAHRALHLHLRHKPPRFAASLVASRIQGDHWAVWWDTSREHTSRGGEGCRPEPCFPPASVLDLTGVKDHSTPLQMQDKPNLWAVDMAWVYRPPVGLTSQHSRRRSQQGQTSLNHMGGLPGNWKCLVPCSTKTGKSRVPVSEAPVAPQVPQSKA